jgi:hypothetical protein
MAKKQTDDGMVTDEVRRYLAENGKRGGLTTKKLIELGKAAAEENGEDIAEEVDNELHAQRRKSA